jgi:hypothetical protein
MSFASVQSQQFGNVQYFTLDGSANATIGRVLFHNVQGGYFIYSLVLEIEIAGTTFGTSDIKIGTNIGTGTEKIINVMKNDVTGRDLYTYNMAGVALNEFEIYLYASSHVSPYNQEVTWTGSLQLIKVV